MANKLKNISNKFKKNIDKEIIKPVKSTTRLFKIEKVVSNWYMLIPVLVIIAFLLFFGLNYVVNILCDLPMALKNSLKYNNANYSVIFSLKQLFRFRASFGLVYLFDFFITAFAVFKLSYLIRTNYKDANIGQKGVSRWTTLDEIKEQYKCIPEKADTYPGGGGVPVCRYKDKIFIDDSPVNNLIIGITRSGKGEMYVFPMIDIYSRAEKQASMVITDPKLELYSASYKTLTDRGYDVRCLNLIQPIKSMGYNPLQLIIDSYKDGNYDDAEMLASTFAYSIFNPSASQGDKFWQTTSANLLVALILAHIEDCLEKDKKENQVGIIKHREKQKAWSLLSDEEKEKIQKEIKQGANINNLYALPEDLEYKETTVYEKQITMYSIYNTFTELGREDDEETGKSALDKYFSLRPEGDRAKLKYASIELAGDKTKGSIFASMGTDLTIFTYTDIAKMTAHTDFTLSDIGFGEKPIAVFLGIPDYDASNHFIASVFIRQLYFTLAKKATLTKSGKCTREVIFLLDEFGNLPPIEGMANIITVSLGRGIRFNLIIQSYAQIEKLYDKDADTIIGNCGNQIYILTNDKQTAEMYSALIGNETITNLNRSGNKLSLNKSFTEMYDEKPLLNPNELMELQEGECVVKRVMKRQDLAKKKIKPTSIFNHNETTFKYRWQYLLEDFPSDLTIDDIDYDKSVKNTKLKDIRYNISLFIEQLLNNENNNELAKYMDINVPICKTEHMDKVKNLMTPIFENDENFDEEEFETSSIGDNILLAWKGYKKNLISKKQCNEIIDCLMQ